MVLQGIIVFHLVSLICAYEPNWKSLDSRPIPLWYDDVKFGIFMHWGVYSVPAFGTGWFWQYWKRAKPDKRILAFMKKNYKPGFTYAEFAPQFTAEFFCPDEFAEIIKASGAKYFVPTSKHHEGFTNWPSNYSWNWNSMDIGPKRDLIGDLRKAVLKVGGVHFGLYFSQFEFYHPLYLSDKAAFYHQSQYPNTVSVPQMHELVSAYQPEVIWSDGDWEAVPAYWQSQSFLAWLYTNSSVKDTVVVNDRWGIGTSNAHGDFYNHEDHFDPGHIMPHKWENAMPMDKKGFPFRRDIRSSDVHTIGELLLYLMRTVSCGGNLLLNVGPTAYGKFATALVIPAIFEERLREMGAWLGINGEAVHHTKPWIYQNDSVTPDIWYTSRLRQNGTLNPRRRSNPQDENNTIVYASFFRWPKYGLLTLVGPKATPRTKVSLLGLQNNSIIRCKYNDNALQIDLSAIALGDLPSRVAWVLRLEYLATEERDPVRETEKALGKLGSSFEAIYARNAAYHYRKRD